MSASELISCTKTNDIAIGRKTQDGGTLKATIFDRKQQICAGTVNYIARIRAISGEVLIYGVAGDSIFPQFAREYVVHPEGRI